MNNKYIIVAGNIASGKTTLTQKLAERTGFTPIYEKVVDNPYLEDFYNDMEKYCFPLQIFFLRHRFVAHRRIVEECNNVIQDRSVFEDDSIFAQNLYRTGVMNQRDYDNYSELFKIMANYFRAPDLVIYLYADIDTLFERIKSRGRDYEKLIQRNYLENINNLYEEWTASFNLCPIKKINSKNVNFHDPDCMDNILSEICEFIDLKSPVTV